MHNLLHQRLIALLLLMAYTITGTSVLPVAVAGLATVAGGHQVLIQHTRDGMKLTLHHRADEFTPCVQDHRNPLARVLVRLCRNSGEGDHQLSSTRIETNADSEKKSLNRICKQPVPMNVAATLQLEAILANCARATMRQGVPLTLPVQHRPASRSVLSTVQMLV